MEKLHAYGLVWYFLLADRLSKANMSLVPGKRDTTLTGESNHSNPLVLVSIPGSSRCGLLTIPASHSRRRSTELLSAVDEAGLPRSLDGWIFFGLSPPTETLNHGNRDHLVLRLESINAYTPAGKAKTETRGVKNLTV